MKLGLTEDANDEDEEERALPVAKEIIKMIKKEMGNKKQKNNPFNDFIEYVAEYKDSIRFSYNGNNLEGGLA